jgi:hypothetical protein
MQIWIKASIALVHRTWEQIWLQIITSQYSQWTIIYKDLGYEKYLDTTLTPSICCQCFRSTSAADDQINIPAVRDRNVAGRVASTASSMRYIICWIQASVAPTSATPKLDDDFGYSKRDV